MRDLFLLGADMYTCIDVPIGEESDLQPLNGPSRYLTIGPDALKSLPEAFPGHQEVPGGNQAFLQSINCRGDV